MSGPSGNGAQADPWAPNEIDLEFPSGRVYTVRRSLPKQWLIAEAMAEGNMAVADALSELALTGGIDAPAVEEGASAAERDRVEGNYLSLMGEVTKAIIESFFVAPKVFADHDQLPVDHDQRDAKGRPLAITVWDLDDADLSFATERALGGVSDAASFRAEGEPDQPGDEGSGDGADVRDEAERDARPEPAEHGGIPG